MKDGSAPGQCSLSLLMGLCLLFQNRSLGPFLLGSTCEAALLGLLGTTPSLPCLSPDTCTCVTLLPCGCRTVGKCC